MSTYSLQIDVFPSASTPIDHGATWDVDVEYEIESPEDTPLLLSAHLTDDQHRYDVSWILDDHTLYDYICTRIIEDGDESHAVCAPEADDRAAAA